MGKLTQEQIDYIVLPGVVRAGEEAQVRIVPQGKYARFDCVNRRMGWMEKWDHLDAGWYAGRDADAQYTVTIIPMEESNEADATEAYQVLAGYLTDDGALEIRYTFPTEQEYILEVREAARPGYRLRLSVYAVEDDLYGLKVYKGDFHVHTHYSDGREDPEVVVANYRKAGFDCMAITDHHKRFPSLEAVDFYRELPVDIKIYPGEEVHEPRGKNGSGYIHALNIGGKGSVNEWYIAHQKEAEREIGQIAESMILPECVQRIDAARRVWLARKVHEMGGMAILVHPHWINNAYNMRDSMSRYLLGEGIYDAFEVLGGQSVHENNMQVALYQELRSEGARIPIVANSDSHGTEPAVYFDWVSTMILARSDSFADIREGIQSLHSVAVESYPEEAVRVHGPYRYVKYVRYLLKYYMPRHDALCYEEGRLMREYACGHTEVLPVLAALQGRTEEWRREFFGGR